jgi:hypothetical protein
MNVVLSERFSSVMGRHFISLISGLASLLFISPASASGDGGGCSVEWKLINPAMTGCNNLSALGPGNDTRVNLLLLLFDRHGTPPERPSEHLLPATDPFVNGWPTFRDRFFPAPTQDTTEYADGEGSRCRSDARGASKFEAALDAASDLPPDERTILRSARKAFMPTCTDDGNATAATIDNALQHLRSTSGQAFATYLQGAMAFYDGRFDEAAIAFISLKGNAEPWIADTAAYMVARVEVNHMQVGAFDQYGEFRGSANVDQQAATRAEASLKAYLHDHPEGQYAASARGLLRRVNWLAGRTDKLAAQYAELLAKAPAIRGISDDVLAEEMDSKLLPRLTPQLTSDPTLLAVADLLRMRETNYANKNAYIGLDELEAQRPAFGTTSPLFEYLLAVHAFYIDHDNAAVLKLLPDDARRRDGGYLWFSRQLLRGLALEGIGDRNARGFWIELHPGAANSLERSAIELGLAMHDERHGRLQDVFATGSLVNSPTIREILLANVAHAALLRQQSRDSAVPEHEREMALFTLLYKEMTRGYYADFLADIARVPSDAPVYGSVVPGGSGHPPLGVFTHTKMLGDFDCPPLRTTVRTLARNSYSTHARLCLAEFVRVNSLDNEPVDTQLPKDRLAGTNSLFPGKPYARAATYQAIIADTRAPAADRAFALFRAVNCYAPAGINQCDGTSVRLAQRKAWFIRLKQEYPSSPWAKKLRYWW